MQTSFIKPVHFSIFRSTVANPDQSAIAELRIEIIHDHASFR